MSNQPKHSNITSAARKMFDGFTTRSQHSKQQKEKEKCILGVCAVFKELSVVQGTPIIGAGFLVKKLFPGVERKYHLVTCEAVIPSKNLEGYLLCFKNLDLTDKKRVPLQSVVNAEDDFIRHSGLVFIPLDPGKLKPSSGLVNHRPFRTRIERQGFELYCQVVEENGMSSYVVKPHQLLENENGQYSLSEFRHDSSRKRLPVAPITIDVDGEAVVVGALTSTENASPVFFSQLKIVLTSSGTRDDMQLVSGETVLGDRAPASDSADRREHRINCGVQSSASELGEIRQGRLRNDVQGGRTAAATCSEIEVRGTRGHMQLGFNSTVSADGATASGSAERRDQQTNCKVQSSASELGQGRESCFENDLLERRTAAATSSGREVEENSSIFISSETSEASSDRGSPGSRSTFKTAAADERVRDHKYKKASQRPSQRPRRKSNLRYEPRRGSDAAATRSESEEASSSSVSRQTSQVNSDREHHRRLRRRRKSPAEPAAPPPAANQSVNVTSELQGLRDTAKTVNFNFNGCNGVIVGDYGTIQNQNSAGEPQADALRGRNN